MTDSMIRCKGNLISELYMCPNCYAIIYFLDGPRVAAPPAVLKVEVAF
jgi:hypothetical protein